MEIAKKKHKGFSLIELVVVFSIMSVLAVAIIVRFNEITQDAKLRTWQANCRNVSSAVSMYQAAHNGELPQNTDELSTFIGGGWGVLFKNGDPNSEGVPEGADYSFENGVFRSSYPGEEEFVFPR